uniref:Cytochrome P450 n=1 Tax=Anopheles farauti TaxID=69004 RepID=A0A182Q8U9_9DIPT
RTDRYVVDYERPSAPPGVRWERCNLLAVFVRSFARGQGENGDPYAMLKLTVNPIRLRPSGLVRWRSTAAAQQPTATEDPEWDNALPFEKIPTPSLLGFLKEFGPFGPYKNATMYDLHRRMREMFGPLILMKGMFGREDIVMTFEPEDFEKVFRSEGLWPRRTGMDAFVYFRKHHRPEYFQGYGGLLAEQGEDWYKTRKTVNPIMMQPKIIKQYVSKVDVVAQEFMEIVHGLRDEKNELPANFNEYLNRWALETMGVLVLDTRLGVLDRAQTPEVKRWTELTKDAVELFYTLDVLPSPWRKIKTPGFHKLMRTLDELTQIISSKLDEAVVRMEKNPSADSDTLSILEKLLKVNPKVAYTMSMDSLFAGIDTTSSGVTGLLYLLAKNPAKQEKLRAELRTIMPDKKTPLTPESMHNMPYLRACIKEGLRLYPPTSGNGRCAGRNLVLQGYQIPKGVLVGMGQLVLQREEGFFPRASEFLPERWLTAEARAGCPSAKEVNPFIYLPFGFGPRSCIGRRLAMLEMEIMISRIVRSYDIRWNYGEMKYRASIVNVPATDLQFELNDLRD